MSDLDFTDKTVFIVGGSSGIGNGTAHCFRQRGATVWVAGTRATREDYAGEEGSDLAGIGYVRLDISDPDAIAAFEPPFATLDVLVLCQGTVLYKRAEFEREGWDKVMAVNIDSVMHCACAFRPMIAAAQGALIIVSSVSGYRSNFGNPAYAASKAAAISLTKTLAQAWIGDGIRVNGIAPGAVHTKLTQVTLDHPRRREQALARIPIGRLARPEEMGNVALFLASPLSSYVVGQTLIVDGGLLLP